MTDIEQSADTVAAGALRSILDPIERLAEDEIGQTSMAALGMQGDLFL